MTASLVCQLGSESTAHLNVSMRSSVRVMTVHNQVTWSERDYLDNLDGPDFKLGKEYVKAVYCHRAYLTYMQSISCKMPDWMKHKLESRLPGEISIPSDMQMTTPLWQKEKLKSLLMKVKEWKSCLKTQHSKNKDHGNQSHHFMANRWRNNGNNDKLFSWAPKSLQVVTAAMKFKDTCSFEEKLWPT